MPETVFSNAQKVAEFHRTIGKILPERPTVPDAAELAFRLTLLNKSFFSS